MEPTATLGGTSGVGFSTLAVGLRLFKSPVAETIKLRNALALFSRSPFDRIQSLDPGQMTRHRDDGVLAGVGFAKFLAQ